MEQDLVSGENKIESLALSASVTVAKLKWNAVLLDIIQRPHAKIIHHICACNQDF